MTFWSSVLELRKQQKIPRVWSLADLRPYLRNQFSEGTIINTPSGQSISVDGTLMGSLIRRGRKPMAIRLRPGVFTLVDDPEIEASAPYDAASAQ